MAGVVTCYISTDCEDFTLSLLWREDEDNNKLDLQEAGWESTDWIDLPQDSDTVDGLL